MRFNSYHGRAVRILSGGQTGPASDRRPKPSGGVIPIRRTLETSSPANVSRSANSATGTDNGTYSTNHDKGIFIKRSQITRSRLPYRCYTGRAAGRGGEKQRHVVMFRGVAAGLWLGESPAAMEQNGSCV